MEAELIVDAHVLPATAVSSVNAIKILKYINSTKNPTAINPARTVLHSKPAPYTTSFSSRGPNVISPSILKPDITATGLNILAAWSGDADNYKIISGASMSCSHVAAAATLLKSRSP